MNEILQYIMTVDVDAVAARNAPPYSFPTTHPTIHPQLAPYMPGGKFIIYLFLISLLEHSFSPRLTIVHLFRSSEFG